MANKSKCIIACEHCFEVCHGVVRCVGHGYVNNFGDEHEVGNCTYFKPKGKNIYRVSVPVVMTYDIIASDEESAKRKIIQLFGSMVVDDYVVLKSSKYDIDSATVTKT